MEAYILLSFKQWELQSSVKHLLTVAFMIDAVQDSIRMLTCCNCWWLLRLSQHPTSQSHILSEGFRDVIFLSRLATALLTLGIRPPTFTLDDLNSYATAVKSDTAVVQFSDDHPIQR